MAGILVATLGVSAIDRALQDGLRDRYILTSPSAGAFGGWSDWRHADAGQQFAAYTVYTITNPWAVATQGAKPAVAEVGPLHYRYVWRRVNASWSDSNASGPARASLLSYTQYQGHVPADDATVALERVTVTTAYLPLLGALADPVARVALQIMPDYTDPMALWVNRTVGEVLWGWEHDPLLDILRVGRPELPLRFPGLQGGVNDSSVEEAMATRGRNTVHTGAANATEEMRMTGASA